MNTQIRVVGGDASLQVVVRGESFDCLVCKRHDGWRVSVRGTHTRESVDEPRPFTTWAAAYRAALRLADGMAPFRSHERRSP